MKTRWILLGSLLSILLLALIVGLSQAQGPEPPEGGAQPQGEVGIQAILGTAFTYQGRLLVGGNPVSGTYDFEFRLYNAEIGGTQVGSTVTKDDISVNDGLFTVQLDFGDVFYGTALWLQIGVRPGDSTGAYTTLSPRQPLTAAPYALGLRPGAQVAGTSGTILTLSGGSTGLYASGTTYGVYGFASATGGTNYGVYGQSNSTSGRGVYGWAATVSGTTYGVYGGSASTDGRGVYGYASATTGTTYGVYGQSDSTSGFGVYGRNTKGVGGAFEGSDTGDAVDISLVGDPGRIVAYGGTNSRLSLRSNGNVIIALDSDQNGTNIFYITSGPNTRCTVNEDGDLTCTGTKSAVVDTAGYGRRKMYAVESPEVWYEDLGTATLANGEVTVAFDPIFAETVNLREDYHVFLTPLSQEPVLLYVTAKTPDGFTVRGMTLDGRPAACSLDYRVVAKRLGYEGVRLELADWLEEAE